MLARCVCTPRRQVAVRNLVRLRASCSLSYVARRSAHRRVRVRAGTFYSVNDRSAWLPAVRAVKAREWHPQRCDGRERRPRLVRGLLDGRGRLKLGHEVRAPLECHRVRLETAAGPASASTCGPKPKLLSAQTLRSRVLSRAAVPLALVCIALRAKVRQLCDGGGRRVVRTGHDGSAVRAALRGAAGSLDPNALSWRGPFFREDFSL